MRMASWMVLSWLSTLAIGCQEPAPPQSQPTSREALPSPAPSPSSPAPSAAPVSATAFRAVYVEEIDWRTGGRALFARSDGSGVLRVAGKWDGDLMPESRYDLAAGTVRFAAIDEVLTRHKAAELAIDPMSAPGDDKSTVILRPPSGKEVVLDGVSNRNPAFQALLRDLLPIVEAIDVTGLEASYAGAIDANWKPPAE